MDPEDQKTFLPKTYSGRGAFQYDCMGSNAWGLSPALQKA